MSVSHPGVQSALIIIVKIWKQQKCFFRKVSLGSEGMSPVPELSTSPPFPSPIVPWYLIVNIINIHKFEKGKSLRNRLFSLKKKLRKKCVNPGVIFGPFGGNFGPFWVIFGPFWIILGHSRAILGHLGSYLGHFGPFWIIFGHFWAILWHFWTNLRKIQFFLRPGSGRRVRF